METRMPWETAMETVTRTKLFRQKGRVVLRVQVSYPRIAGEGEGVARFNAAYERAADAFLETGMALPLSAAEQTLDRMSPAAQYGFARWEVSCDMSACSFKEGVVEVRVEAKARQRYAPATERCWTRRYFWQFPQGWMLSASELEETGKGASGIP